ncbi:MAG: fumarylacetoacetate hydrolase family protein [Parasphingorhabdus sp.]|uniref:fumarylacetoacetate hydrolase family protein n=1 Tax=Parasphingorhabdus sp. TaxID=2709688 RepID=UPI0032635ADF
MQLAHFRHKGRVSLGMRVNDELVDLTAAGGPASLDAALADGGGLLTGLEELAAKADSRIAVDAVEEWLPPILAPGKAIAIGLNYVDHAAEGAHEVPDYPIIFTRYPSSWVGHKQPIIQPKVSKILDYEGEMVIVIGKGGRAISKERAHDHVAGYSIFNEGSIRDYQLRTHQWTIGKNFDSSGSFGPFFVSADELPPGASGLQLRTVLNGKEMQSANTADMVFDVATLVSTLSEVMTLSPGDIIISGTPAGVGGAQKPPVFMQPGDVCEVSIDGIGVLSNTIELEQ